MGRKKRKGLREAILSAAAESPISASMLQDAAGSVYGVEPTSLSAIFKNAERLRESGLLEAERVLPEAAYRGGHAQTFYRTTPAGIASLAEAVQAATADWSGEPQHNDGRTKAAKGRDRT